MAFKKGMKRAASALSTQRYHKKARHTDVVSALKESNLQIETKKMLCRALRQSILTFADERHECQQAVMEMSQEALLAHEKDLEAIVSAAHAKIVTIDDNQLQAAVLQHARVRAELKKALATKEAAIVEATMKFKRAQEAHSSVSKQRKAENKEYAALSSHKQTFDETAQRFQAMKGDRADRRRIAKLEADLKAFGVDQSIAATLHSVLVKVPAERGEFDALAMANLDAELASKGKELEAKLSVLEPARAEHEAAVNAAQAALDSARVQLETTKATLSDAHKSLGAGEAEVTTAESDLKNMDKNLRSAQDGLKKAEKRLATFQAGPLTTFREHLSRTRAQPEPPAPEEPVAA